MPRPGVLSLSLWSRTHAEAVRLAVLPTAAVRAAVVEIEPAAGRHAGVGRDFDGSRDGGSGLVDDGRSAFTHQRQSRMSDRPRLLAI